MSAIQFGTDGWRALIADTFTFANVERVAQATASHWRQQPAGSHPNRVVIGYDRRFLSDAFAWRTAEVFAANGFEPVLTATPTPTPAVSLAVRDLGAVGGVMITASHNPAAFNGFKLKTATGAPAEPSVCRAVESKLDAAPIRRTPISPGSRSPIRIRDLRPAHYRAIRRYADYPRIAASGLKVAHDALFGVGAGCFDALLAGTSCQVTTLNGAHDPNFGGIHPEPIPANYRLSQPYLRAHPHDICLVTDGDADRIGAMDGRGVPLSTHQVICLLLRHFVLRRQGRGRVVKAITTTSMVDKICSEQGLELRETGVGFKHIAAEMLRGGVLLGFEESGGIGFPGHLPERDGLLAGMLLLEVLATESLPVRTLLRRLEHRYGPHRYGRQDLAFPVERRVELLEACRQHPPARLLRSPVERVQAADGVKLTARDGSWLMIRGSGTEPVVRVYAEAGSDKAVQDLLACGRRLIRRL